MTIRSGISEQEKSLTSFICDLIVADHDITGAFDLIKRIRGVENKGASFYLRDLVDAMAVLLDGVKNKHLLQPVDIWVEGTVKALAKNQTMNRSGIAAWIVDVLSAYNIKPERVNGHLVFQLKVSWKRVHPCKSTWKSRRSQRPAKKLWSEY